MSRNATIRRIARVNRPTAVVPTEDGPVTVRRQIGRGTAERTAVVASRYGYDV